MALHQEFIQSQQTALNQALRQSIEILGLSSQELSQRIQKELLENPVLEEIEEIEEIERVEENDVQQENLGETDPLLSEKPTQETPFIEQEKAWEFGDAEPRRETPFSFDLDAAERKHQFIQNTEGPKESLGEHLLWQLRLSSLGKEEQKIGETLVSALDERGFLCLPPEDVLAHVSKNKITEVLRQIQSLDPIGCGAQSVSETLLIQVRHRKPEDKITQNLLENYFSEIEKLQFKKIEKDSGIKWEDIQNSLQFIRSLEPYPGHLYTRQTSQYIIPDVIVHIIQGELRVVMGGSGLPPLQVINGYEDILKNTHMKKEEKTYLKEKHNSAQLFIRSIRKRQDTLLQVSLSIVEHQKEFFLKGPQNLQPLILRVIAEKLDMHESTISRAIANKYIQSKWGYFELKYFFTGKLKSTISENEVSSNRNVQERIRTLITEENRASPLSDKSIQEIFQKSGIQIARRTVSKYRKIMGIPSAKQRYKIGLLQQVSQKQSTK